jgi:hypothetical protein
LFTLTSDNRRYLRRDDQPHSATIADVLEKDCVALLFLTKRLHDIELRTANAEKRDDSSYRNFGVRDVGKAIENSDGPVKGVYVRRDSVWIVRSLWLHFCTSENLLAALTIAAAAV